MNKTITQFPLRATRMLFAVLLMTMTTQTAWADEIYGWVFEKNQPGTECYVTKYTGNTSVSELIIPSTLGGAKVISISGIDFSSFLNLVTLKFPSGCVLTSMPSVTGCPNLSNIMDGTISNRLPSSITTIGQNCFKGTAITELTMPGVTSVDANAFEGCPLQEVSFGRAATIESWAFANITTVCNISYPGPMTNWGPDKYVYSNNLLVSGTDNEKDWFCGWCGGTNGSGNYLYWTVDTEGQMTIKPRYDSFDSDKQVFTTLRWKENNIKTKIKSVTIQDVYSICDDAFNGCAALTSVTIPASVTSIGDWAFQYCSALTTLTFDGIPTLASIGNEAFQGCTNLTSVTIPASVTSIGEMAFQNCSALATLTFDGTPTLASIGSEAFQGCTNLTSVTIPTSVTDIENNVFANCTSLTNIPVDATNTAYKNDERGALLSKDGERFVAYPIGNTATSYDIPFGVTTIEGSAFNGCSALTAVTIPYGVTKIKQNAFHGCSGLTSIIIPASVTYIGDDAFFECNSMADVYCYVTNRRKLDWSDINCDDFKGNKEETKCHVFDKKAFDRVWATGNKYDDVCVTFVGDLETIPFSLTELEGVSHLEALAGKTLPVQFSRTFTSGVASTLCLPFDFTPTSGTCYEFTSVDENWTTVTMTSVNPTSETPLTACKPYLFMPAADGQVDFTGIITNVASSYTAGTTTPDGSPWTFTGTYEEKRWDATHNTEEIGRIFGFATGQGYEGKDAVEAAGVFIRLNSGGIKPFRAYLKYTGTLARTRGEGGLPERMTVRLVNANGEIQGIGEIKLDTGEVTFDSRAWYDLNGRRLDGQPSEKGIYINGGRKVVIK